MTDLIEALEKATGPSRELDLELWWACKANHSGQPMDADYKAQNLKLNDAPRYTSSIDAALTLREGEEYQTIIMALALMAAYFVEFRDTTKPGPIRRMLPIFISIAALKARQVKP